MDELARGLLKVPPGDGPIRFRGGPLSNFAVCNISLRDPFNGAKARYLTVEHRFQAMKARDPADHAWVAEAPTARVAKERGRIIRLREDWEAVKVEVMREALRAKFSLPNGRERAYLQSTAPRDLIEDAPWDDVWGSGKDGNGQNLLGKLLVEIRDTVHARTPRYVHDCDECTFLGEVDEYDVYVHPRDYAIECVARRSDDPSDYLSGQRATEMAVALIQDGAM